MDPTTLLIRHMKMDFLRDSETLPSGYLLQ